MSERRSKNNNIKKQATAKSSVSSVKAKNAVEFSPRKLERKRRNERFVTVFILSSLLFVICAVISVRVLFVVRNVQATGSERYSEEEIVAYCDIPIEISLFTVDIDLLEQRIYEDFTYVDSVNVKYSLPDTISIEIEDAVMTYYLIVDKEDSGADITKYDIYSQSLKHLTSQAVKPAELFGIKADIEDEEIIELAIDIRKTIENSGYDKMKEIYIESVANVQIVYDNRIIIQLGTMLDLDYKLELANHVITNELLQDDTGVLDCSKAGEAIYKPNVDISELL